MGSRKKIVLFGAGQIGATAALLSGMKDLGDIALYDIVEGMPMGKGLDMSQLSAIEGFDSNIQGGNKEEMLAGADVIIVTAGVPRLPGMSRDDLVGTNSKVIRTVGELIRKHCKRPLVICVTNPLDAMVMLLREVSQLPAELVVGMAGVLDAARFKFFLSEKLCVSVEDIQALVLGGHGDAMVPLIRHTSVGGIPLSELISMGKISQAEVESIVQRTRQGGGEIVALLKSGSAFYAPASSAVQMAESYLKDKKRILCCSAFLNGEYGVTGHYVGVPCVIGAKGVEQILEIELNKEERAMFDKSVEGVKELNSVTLKYLER